MIFNKFLQDTTSKCFGSSKTSRINLVDLAGLDRKKNDVVGTTKEGKSVKKSLSRLGYEHKNLALVSL